MTAHSQVPGVVEEDDSGRAGRIGRLAQERSYDSVPAAWLFDDALAKSVRRLPETIPSLIRIPTTETPETLQDPEPVPMPDPFSLTHLDQPGRAGLMSRRAGVM